MVDKLTPRLGLPEPFLTNPLKVDVGRLQQALEMIDSNAVMLTDWDITADGWQKMGTIKGLAQGKIAASLMVVTGTGFANILFQTGDGTVTTVGDPARMTVSAQTNLGANAPTFLGGRVVETAADEYEIWFNIAVGTSPRKWSGLLIAGNGATIDWTHAMGTQPSDGVDLQISRALTSFDVASDTRTDIGTLLSTGHLGSGVVQLDYLTTVDLKGRLWKTGELVRIKKADATDAKGFPPALVSADPSATGWFIRCLSINDTRTVKEFEFTSESAGVIRAYKARLSGTTWSVAKVYTSLDKPTANDISAIGMRAPVTGTVVVNLNDMYGPDYYGATAIKSTASAVAANNYPFDEVGTVLVLPFGDTFSCTQLYVTQSGRVAARSYDGSTWTTWRKQANSGVNDDITSMTGLTGSLKLGGDGVGDYDAVTMRQLKASSGGSGPTMNGVVNNFVGAVEWWNGPRGKIPAGYVPADGQALSRVLYPEAAAAIDAGVFSSIDEATWLTSADQYRPCAWRSSYSKGGAAGTSPGSVTPDAWFRVPDLNGVTQNAIKHLFLSGSSGASSEPSVGQVWAQSAPNIADEVTRASGINYGNSIYPVLSVGGQSKAFYSLRDVIDSVNNIGSVTSNQNVNRIMMDANKANKSYGRGSQYQTYLGGVAVQGSADNIGDLYPNHAVGIWIIRVAGSFVAANTNFSVIAGDTALPSNNTSIKGGQIISDYQVAGVSECKAMLQAVGTVGTAYSARITVFNKTRNNTANFDMRDDGSMNVPGTLTSVGLNVTGASNLLDCRKITFGSGGIINGEIASINSYSPGVYDNSTPNKQARGTQLVMRLGSSLTASSRVELYPLDYQGNYFCAKLYCLKDTGGYGWEFRNQDGTLHGSGAYVVDSDIRVKSDLEKVKNPLQAVLNWRGVTYKRKDVDKREVGLIAQDVEPWSPEAISVGTHTSFDQKTTIDDFKSLNYSGLSAAFHTEAIKELLLLLDLALTDPEKAKVRIAGLKKEIK